MSQVNVEFAEGFGEDLQRLARRVSRHEEHYLQVLRELSRSFPRLLSGKVPPVVVGHKTLRIGIAADGVFIMYFHSAGSRDVIRFEDVRPSSTRTLVQLWTKGVLDFTPPSNQIEWFTSYSATPNDPTDWAPWERLFIWLAPRASMWTNDHAEWLARHMTMTLLSSRLVNLGSASAKDVRTISTVMTDLLDKFELLLDSSPPEESLQKFLTEHPILLQPDATAVHPKFRLGSDYIPDFVIERPQKRYLFVELERSSAPLFTSKGNPSAALTHAVRQVEDWLNWADRNISYLESKLPGMMQPSGLVVLGRSVDMSDDTRRNIQRRRSEFRRISIRTYDDLLTASQTYRTNLFSLWREAVESSPSE